MCVNKKECKKKKKFGWQAETQPPSPPPRGAPIAFLILFSFDLPHIHTRKVYPCEYRTREREFISIEERKDEKSQTCSLYIRYLQSRMVQAASAAFSSSFLFVFTFDFLSLFFFFFYILSLSILFVYHRFMSSFTLRWSATLYFFYLTFYYIYYICT